MSQLVAACVWRISDDLVVSVAEQLGEPTDCYVNGSQTWLIDNGPRAEMLEWRLHPVADYVRPDGLDTFDVWPAAAARSAAIAGEPTSGSAPEAGALWDGLEAFPAYTADVEPGELRTSVIDALGVAPDAFGLVDHSVIGDAWEQARGNLSVIDALLAQLRH